MALIRSLFACAAVVYLSGCASSKLPDSGHTPYAWHAVVAEQCVARGSVSAEVAGMGMAASNKRLRSWRYSPDTLEAEKSRLRTYTASEANCRELQRIFYTLAHEEGLLGGSQSDGRSWRDLDPAPANIPKTTWCNKLGQSVVCNTY